MGFDVPRTAWHPDGSRVFNNDHATLRPRLAVPLKTFTVHYVGAGAFTDLGDSLAEMRAIDRYAASHSKANEYNSASDSEGRTIEYAGPYQAAHSRGENDWAWGHLVLLGLETPTKGVVDMLVTGVRKARAQAVAAGWLTPDHKVVPHKGMPGASTACPGPVLLGRWDQITAPLHTTTPEPDWDGLLTIVEDGENWPKIAGRVTGLTGWTERVAAGEKIEAVNPGVELHPGTVVRVPGRVVL